MNVRRRPYKLINAIVFTFAISILMGQLSPVRSQANESEQFFDEGREEFEREAETLENPQNSIPQPQLTIDENPSIVEENPAPNEDLGLDGNLPDQPTNEEIRIKF